MFQDVWVIKFPWAKIIIGPKEKMTHVSCRICNEVENREKLLVLKFDGLQKHACYWKKMSTHPRVVVSQYYISNISQHVKNETQYAIFHGRTFMAQQVANGNSIRCKRKFI
jgi:hypothetical protein